MFRTLRKTLTIALAILCVTSVLALAADGTLSGTVQNVDPRQGRLTVKAGEDTVVELRAPAALLIGLQNGDVVDVTRSGQHATVIRWRGAAHATVSGCVSPYAPAVVRLRPAS